MKRIAVWGWWQGNNLGDNWIKSTLNEFFPSAEFIPTSIQDFDGYDFVICGGGGLFIYDVINPFKKVELGVPYGLLGVGAEFKHESDIALQIEKKAKFFYVRDDYSRKCMNLSIDSKSYDVTFLKPLPWKSLEEIDLDKLFLVWREGDELLNNNKFEKYICYRSVKEEWMSLLESNYTDITFDDFQTQNFDILDRMGNCGFVISGRYHGIVAAIQRGLPFIAIDICPKIRALVEECGLSEFCVKVSEIDKVQYLIDCAKDRLNEIRIKEREYINKANICLLKQMLKIKQIIYANAYKYRLLHYGSYWMGKNDVVNAMSDDLKTIANIKKINLNAYSLHIDNRIDSISKTPNGSITVLNTSRIISDIEEYNPDAIILNSGGLCMKKELIDYLKEKKVVSIGISLSDPDVYPYNGKVYSKEFDLFYTNSKWSLMNQYDSSNIKLLPFAASIIHHYFMPNIEKKYDVVIVGHAREDRMKVVKKLSKVCNLGLYGGGWENGLGIVNGLEQVRAINSGKMYLSFSHTNSGYENVKVGLFEAMACRQLVLTSYMEELSDYFEIGKEIVCYKDDEELLFLVDYYLRNEDEREKIINAGYLRFMKCHTYIQRWCNVIEDIDALYTRK